MNETLGTSAAANRHPEHKITISPEKSGWLVLLNGQVLARSTAALALNENNYPPVVYFPPNDVRTDLLKPSDSHTTCPFKGDATYYAAEIDGQTLDVAWSYPVVYEEVSDIAEYIAFYVDRVELSRDTDSG